MGNFIISQDHYDTLFGYHESDRNIKLYFGEEFELDNKFLQKAKVFNGKIPELKKPKIKILSTEADVSDMIRGSKD